jgi:multidrug resistance efflux pump
MKLDAAHAKAQLQAASGGKARVAVASSIAKPEFKKHIHTNNAKNKTGECEEGAGAEVMSRRQLKNLAKRKKKEAAAAAAAANDSSSSAVLPPSSTSAPAGGASAPAKAKKAPLDPGKKAEVNCNWQALKKALVSGGPLVTGSVLGVQFSLVPHSRPTRPRHRGLISFA